MRLASKAISRTYSSDRYFWACFAVVMALLTQVFFPPQVMAMPSDHGVRMVLCTPGIDGAPIVDKASEVVLKSTPHKNALQGLKCANCVLASVTAIQTPEPTALPVVYASTRIDFVPNVRTGPIKARAPPRPYSCGPPSFI
jgi:hypothetical protein